MVVWGKEKFYFHIDVLHIHIIHFLCTNILSCQKFKNIYLHFTQNNANEKTTFIKNSKSIIAISNYKNSLAEENEWLLKEMFIGFFLMWGRSL